MTRPSPVALYFDTDLGIDDSLALAYLLASPEVEVKGIGTVSGNCSAAQAARNTLNLLGLAERPDIPVAVGCTDWLAQAFDGGSPGLALAVSLLIPRRVEAETGGGT